MELQWIGVAFALGFVARRLGQPPLLGFLAAGFVLELLGARPDASLEELADIGVKLMLFGIGLKLDLRTVIRPQVWGVTLLHMAATTAALGALALGLGAAGLGLFGVLDWKTAALVGFALSFSSTVYVVKVLEERDDLGAVYGRIAIGILVVQDLAAVVFLAASSGKLPSPWALGLLLLLPLRRVLLRALDAVGHGELLVLAGLAATLGGAGLFEVVGMKGDLGALVAGVLLGGQGKSDELAKSLLGLKDVFLVGFFLTVGLTGLPTLETALVGAALVLLAPLKGALFFWLLARFDLRVRSSLFAGVSLGNYSEFGLIVGALAASKGWLPREWLIVFAIAVAVSFLASSPLNARTYALYERWRKRLARLETRRFITEEQPVDVGDAEAIVFGMGRVGESAYDALRERFGERVVGFDLDADVVARQQAAGRRVVLASATDADFFDRLHVDRERVQIVLLAMSSHVENLAAIDLLRKAKLPGLVAASARYGDEVEELRAAGADVAFHVLAEAGAGLVRHALEALDVHNIRRSQIPPAGPVAVDPERPTGGPASTPPPEHAPAAADAVDQGEDRP
jgi:predicted Kef-type K+ transport protein